MNGFSFDTLEVTEGNRAALEACRQVAALQYAGGSVVLLLGPEGAGKSHLLWSIAKQVRAGAEKAGLALIMAREFPAKVRDIAANPAPIRGGRRAILLIDQLQDFRELAGDLEAVVRAFLEHGQVVVACSNVHPGRLSQFSPSFQKLLSGAEIVEIAPRPPVEKAPPPPDAAVAALRAEVDSLREARDRLARRLAEDSAAEDMAEEATASEASELAALRAERAALEAKLAEQAEAASAVAPLRGQLAEAEALSKTLRDRLRRSESEAEAAFAEQARLQGQLGAHRRTTEALAESEKQLEAERAQLRRAREALAELLAWANLDAAGQEPVEAVAALVRGLGEQRFAVVPREVEEARERQIAEALEAVETLQQELTQTQAERDARQEALDKAAAQALELTARLDARDAELARARFELEKSRRQMGLAIAEMDALRHEAAEQVASANVHAGELEARIVDLESTLALYAGTSHDVGGALADESEALSEAAERFSALARRLNQLPRMSVGSGATAAPQDQALLFETGGPQKANGALSAAAQAMFALETPPQADDEEPDA